MRFTSLHLTGFKSFVDPTALPIEPGLTGIVGPNGCGKSNLVEALRWVLGETSAKAMRGGEMDDVIFAGTTKRSPKAHAEVGLDIDNTSRRAPSGLNDSDILRVTRRITREQGSIYRVNGKETRARDVHTMFADVATGADSPAMVRQGRISELINAKPQSRRQILEEAAGTAGLHARRHEAELRLRAAENNLLRLDDVMQQIEVQLTQLKRQARQSTRYRNLAVEIRRSEAILFHLRWSGAKTGVDTAERNLTEANALVAVATAEAARATSEAAACAETLPPLRQAEAEAAAALQRLSMARDALDAERRRLSGQIEALSARIAQGEGDLARENTRVQDADSALARLDGENAALDAARQGESDHLETAGRTVEQFGIDVRAAETELDSLTGRIAALTARRQSLGRDLDSAVRQADRLDGDRKRVEGELTALGPDEDSAKAQALAEKIAEIDAAAEALRVQLQDIEAARATAQSAESEARQMASIASANLARLTEEERSLGRLLDQSTGQKWPGIVDQLSVAPGYERALGAALGEDLGAGLDEAAPAFWRDLGLLDEGQDLPAGIEALSAHVIAPPALARRLGQIGLVEAADAASLSRLLKPGQRLVSREGGLWRWDGYIATSDVPSAAARRMVQRNRLHDLAAERETASRTAGDAAEQHRQAQATVQNQTTQEQATRGGLKAKEGELANLRRDAAEVERTSLARESRRQTLRGALERLAAEAAEAAERKSAASTALDALEPEDALRTAAQTARQQVETARAGLADARAAHDGLKREIQHRSQRLSQIQDERRAWADRKTGAEGQIATLSERLQAAIAERDSVANEPARLEESRLTLGHDIADKDSQRNEAAATLAAAEAALAEADRADRRAQSVMGEAREARAHGEGAVQTARERLIDVEAQIRDALQCPPNQVLLKVDLEDTQELPALEQVEMRLERLRRERDAMGPVNLRADQELKEKDEELAGLANEKADLDAAIAKLKGAIRNLNKEGRDRLTTAFDKVNESFSKLFVHLFSGGEAHLKLSESEDPLEAGLEIFASPPGKKLQNLSLLSGGEQTLTALALIFAVFLTNPAPICVLDEVDAPLDDANVDRFCNLLDEMTRLTETRFLVITHHGITMARMNRLFGVTMMERGISQLVSVDLNRAERLQAAG